MKQTVNVNIGGMIFHLDDDAFEKCKSYLDTLKNKFKAMEGGDEIIHDIESRIAEIFKDKIGTQREVVSLQDVTETIEIMGDPSTFIDEDSQPVAGLESDSNTSVKKRLYRDPEKRILGGVCSGFAAYLNIDPWLVRIICILLVLFAGVSFLLYFVFWVAMPKAVTTSDRLMMRGKKVDIKSIEDSVKKEWTETKSGIKNAGKSANSSSVIQGIGKFVRISMGVIFIFFSTLILAGFIWAMISPSATVHFDHVHVSIREALSMVFDSTSEIVLAYVSAWLLVVVPCVLFIYLGIRAILQFKHRLRYVMLSGFLLWLIGIVLGIYSIINIAEKHKMDASLKENPPITMHNDSTLFVGVINDDNIPGYNMDGLPLENVYFNIEKSLTDSIPMMEVERSSQGSNKQSALDFASKINYHYRVDSNSITLAKYFVLDKKDKFRGQQVNVTLKMPVGYKIYFNEGSESVINDISNVQNVWDHDMPKHTWTMTTQGLSCDDCPADIIRLNKHEEEDDQDSNVKIKVEDEDGVHHIEVN